MSRPSFLAFVASLFWIIAGAEESPLAELREDLQAVASYQTGQSLAPLKRVERETLRRLDDPPALGEWIHTLGRLALDRATTLEGAAWLTHQLGLTGDSSAVPYLEQLGQRAELMDDARMALEQIGTAEAARVLRAWAERVTGDPAVGVLRALARHPDDASVSILLQRLRDGSTGVVLAAATSLAELGRLPRTFVPPPALGTARLPLMDALARARAGDHSAMDMIELLATNLSQPAPVRIAALVSGAELSPSRFLPLCVNVATASDEESARTALALLARHGDSDVARALAVKLDHLPDARRPLAIAAIAECADRSVLAYLRRWLDSDNPDIRRASTALWARRGGPDEATELLRRAASGDSIAFQALTTMRSEALVSHLQNLLGTNEVQYRGLSARLIAHRVQTDLLPALRKRSLASSTAEEAAALAEAYGEIGDASDLTALLEGLRHFPNIAPAVEAACVRLVRRGFGPAMLDGLARHAARADEPVPFRQVLLRVIAQIPCPEALDLLARVAEDPDPVIRTAAARALAQAQTPSAVEAMLRAVRSGRLAESDRDNLIVALLQRLPSNTAALQVIESIQQWADRRATRIAVASALGRIVSPTALDLAVRMIAESELAREEMALATANIAQGLLEQDPRAVIHAARRLRDVPNAERIAPKFFEVVRQAEERLRSHAGADARRRALLDSFHAAARRTVYLDAGVGSAASHDDLSIRITGASHTWDKARSLDPWNASVAFAPEELHLELSGLDTSCVYRVGVTCWDFDGNGRTQSVWMGSVGLLPPVPLPNGALGQPPIELEWTLEPTNPRTTFVIRRHGRSNVVVGEAWAMECAPGADDRDTRRVLVATGEEYPGHPWRKTSALLRDFLDLDPDLSVEIVTDPATWLRTSSEYHAVVLNYMNWTSPTPSADALRGWANAISNGTGLVLVHFASGAFRGWNEYVAIAGRVWNPRLPAHDPHGLFTVRRFSDSHALIANWPEQVVTYDELYTCLDGATPVDVLAVARSRRDQRDYPMVMVHSYGRGRVAHIPLGHDELALSVRAVTRLYHRAVRWVAGLPPVP